jgi:hypothetical protein
VGCQTNMMILRKRDVRILQSTRNKFQETSPEEGTKIIFAMW